MGKQLRAIFSRTDLFALFFLCMMSAFAMVYYVHSGQHLPYADAMSRLNIARKVVDNLTPGLAQFGSVWLPLPQMLMLPFIWNEYLWHSGLAGTFMSAISFIIGGYYLYLSAKLITESKVASLLTLSIYALNINVLYLQTTAMSECIFMTTLSAAMYYFLKWIKTNRRMELIPAGVAVSAMTLIRYESLAVLLSSIPMVLLYSMIHHRSIRKTEGDILLYITVAASGFVFWTLYLTAIFGDPLFWVRYYATKQSVSETTATASAALQQVEATYTQAKPFMAAVWQYFTSVTWMSGVIPVAYALAGLLILPIKSIRDKSWLFLPVLMPLSVFLFMVMTLQRNTPIVQPALTVANIMNPATSDINGFNIRYGLMMFPWIVVMCAYVFNLRRLFLNVFIFLFFSFQLFSYIPPGGPSLIYRIPQRIYGKPYSEATDFMKKNYDGGLILISASGFEDQMFLMGFPYKTYIHEGTGKYWKESLDSPSRYATWVIVDYGHPEDRLGKELKNKNNWQWAYTLVYDSPTAKIYKIIDKPLLEIPGSNIYKPKPKPPSKFVKRSGHSFIYEGKPFRFVGVNIPDLMYRSENEIDLLLESASASGIKVVRFSAYGEGNTEGIQPEPWVFNKNALAKIGYITTSAQKKNLKLIPVLADYTSGDVGGIARYLSWDGLKSSTDSDKSTFFVNSLTKKRYTAQVRTILLSTNPYSKNLLRDEQSILAWELIQIPIDKGNSSDILPWIRDMASFIKSIDQNHLVFSGVPATTNLYKTKGGMTAGDIMNISSIDALTSRYEQKIVGEDVTAQKSIQQWSMISDNNEIPFILENTGSRKEEVFDLVSQTPVAGVLVGDWALEHTEDDSVDTISLDDPADQSLIAKIKQFSESIANK